MNLASQIQNDLGFHLENGRPLPVPLTMDGLSGHYGVSYTPIRKAISGLVEEGLIVKKSNGRLEATGLQTKIKKKRTVSIPKKEDPIRSITQELVHLSLTGENTFVREESTAKKHKLSRAAVRQIYYRLSGEGLLKHIPRRGWQVKPFRQEDLQAFIEIREVMELKALDLGKAKLSTAEAKKELVRIRKSNQAPIEQGGAVSIDNSLHQYLLKLANNPYLNDFFDRHGKYYSILFEWEGEDRKAATEAVAQHHGIIDALLEENWPLAKKRLSYHLHENHPVLSNLKYSKYTYS